MDFLSGEEIMSATRLTVNVEDSSPRSELDAEKKEPSQQAPAAKNTLNVPVGVTYKLGKFTVTTNSPLKSAPARVEPTGLTK